MKRQFSYKSVLFGIILIAISLPAIKNISQNTIEDNALKGAVQYSEKPELTWENWYEGQFQKGATKFVNERFGFRNDLLRFNNQLYYSLFNVARANSVVIGKEHYLYERNYIKAYTGEDYVGEDEINERVKKLQVVRDQLKARDIELVIVFAPGKGSYFPEFIPDEYLEQFGTTNFETYIKALKATNINYVDFKSWFERMKGKSEYPLFPRNGIHWSKYGEYLAADSLIHYLEDVCNTPFPHLELSHIERSSETRDTDQDIEDGMNILVDLEDFEMGYPIFGKTYPADSANTPQVLTVADSYFWGMYNFGMSRDVFRHGQFWFYNQSMHGEGLAPMNVNQINTRDEVEKNDVVILLSTDANLYKFAFGFVDNLYEAYTDPNVPDRAAIVEKYIKIIQNSPGWLKEVEQKAKEKNISLDEALRRDAGYMADKELKNQSN